MKEDDPDAKIYPCYNCGTLRSKNEGGTVFTVCDKCWDEHYKIVKEKQAEHLINHLRGISKVDPRGRF